MGEYDLRGGFSVRETDKVKQSYAFEIIKDSNSFVFYAETQEEKVQWMQVLSKFSHEMVISEDRTDGENEIPDQELSFILEVAPLLISFYLKKIEGFSDQANYLHLDI